MLTQVINTQVLAKVSFGSETGNQISNALLNTINYDLQTTL